MDGYEHTQKLMEKWFEMRKKDPQTITDPVLMNEMFLSAINYGFELGCNTTKQRLRAQLDQLGSSVDDIWHMVWQLNYQV